MRKHKSIISILLAVMMIFTFMPTLAFAQEVTEQTPSYGTVKSISWGDNYHTASAKVESEGKTSTLNFEYFDILKGMPATKLAAKAAEVGNYAQDGAMKLVVIPGHWQNDSFSVYGPGDQIDTVDYVLGYAFARETETTDPKAWRANDYVYDVYASPTHTAVLFEVSDDSSNRWVAEKSFLANEWYQNGIVDAYLMTAYGYDGKLSDDMEVDAHDYAAWFAQKDLKDSLKSINFRYSPVEVYYMGNSYQDDSFFKVEYPAYDAYEVANGLEIKVTLDQAAFKKEYGSSVKFGDTTKTITFKTVSDVNNNAYFTRPAYNAANVDSSGVAHKAVYGWYIEDNDTFNANYPTTYDNVIAYDGKTHGFAFVKAPKNATVKYYVVKADKNGNYVAPKSADWTDTFPGIKDSGTYFVAIQLTVNGQTVNEDGQQYTDVVVTPMPVKFGFKQEHMRVEYGKLDAAALEEAIKKTVVVKETPDAADKVAEVFSKYLKVEGLFEDAGDNTLKVFVDTKKLSDDKELAEAVKNYDFSKVGEMWLTIEKADNGIEIKAKDKTFKGKGKGKARKLAKKKTFKISATADFGTAKFTKVSGNAKITVSKTGKVTVKKGLKKGSYNVKVKAVAKGTANYARGEETATFTVTIK